MSYGPPIHPEGARVRLVYGMRPARAKGYEYVRRERPTDADRDFLFPFAGEAGTVLVPPWGPGKRNEVVRLDRGLTTSAPAGNLRLVVDAAPGAAGGVR